MVGIASCDVVRTVIVVIIIVVENKVVNQSLGVSVYDHPVLTWKEIEGQRACQITGMIEQILQAERLVNDNSDDDGGFHVLMDNGISKQIWILCLQLFRRDEFSMLWMFWTLSDFPKHFYL